GEKVVIVRAGREFGHDGSSFTVDPASPADFARLMQSLNRDSQRPSAFVHLWCVDAQLQGETPSWHERGFYGLLHLAQALGETSSKLRVDVITSGLHDVTGEETLAPGKATVLGPVRVM